MKKTAFAVAALAAVFTASWLGRSDLQAETREPRWTARTEYTIGIEKFTNVRWKFLEVYTGDCVAAVQPFYTYTDAAVTRFYGAQYLEQADGYSVFPVHKWGTTFGVWSPECGWLMTERPVAEIKPLPTGRRRRSARD